MTHESEPGVVRSLPTSFDSSDKKTALALTRRGFLSGVGAVVAGIGAGGFGAVAASALAAEAGTALEAAPVFRPRIGALYEPGFTPDSSLWKSFSEIPAAGRYDSGSHGTIDTHVVWAKTYGIDFFLVSYRHDARHRFEWPNVGKLFSQADRDHLLKIAVMIQPDAESAELQRRYEKKRLGGDSFVEAMSTWLAVRYDAIAGERGWFERPSYLKEEGGRRIFGFVAGCGPASTCEILDHLFQVRPDIADQNRVWYAGGHDVRSNLHRVRRVLSSRSAAWFPYAPLADRGWSETVALYESLSNSLDQRVISVSPSFRSTANNAPVQLAPRDNGERLRSQLEEVRKLSTVPHYVVINSFNDWKSGSAIEPSTQRHLAYLKIIGEWKRSWA